VLYVSIISGQFLVSGTIPLYYEAGVETAYPVAEGLSTGAITFMNNVGSLLFLFVPMIIKHTKYINWTLLVGLIISLVLIFFFREKHERYDID